MNIYWLNYWHTLISKDTVIQIAEGHSKVAPPSLTNFIIYPLCFLTAFVVTSWPQLFSRERGGASDKKSPDLFHCFFSAQKVFPPGKVIRFGNRHRRRKRLSDATSTNSKEKCRQIDKIAPATRLVHGWKYHQELQQWGNPLLLFLF